METAITVNLKLITWCRIYYYGTILTSLLLIVECQTIFSAPSSRKENVQLSLLSLDLFLKEFYDVILHYYSAPDRPVLWFKGIILNPETRSLKLVILVELSPNERLLHYSFWRTSRWIARSPLVLSAGFTLLFPDYVYTDLCMKLLSLNRMSSQSDKRKPKLLVDMYVLIYSCLKRTMDNDLIACSK